MTTDFSRSYMPPGIYIEESESLVVETSGVPPTVVALVGQTRGYMLFTEQVKFGSTPVTLSKQGIDLANVSVTVVSTRAEVAATDYTLTKANDQGGQDYQVTLVETGNNDLDEGTPVFVTYRYVPTDYYSPRRFTSFEDVKDYYGEPLNLSIGSATDSSYQHVLSPLSLGAKVAFENGAAEVVLCAATPPPTSASTDAAKSTARRTALKEAYEKMGTLAEVNVLVPLPTGIATNDAAGVLTDLSAHLDLVASDGFRRFGIIGFDLDVTTAPDTLLSGSGVSNRRLMLAYIGPGGGLMYSGGVNATFGASHAYLAAAYGGMMAARPVQNSLTKGRVRSFQGLGGTPLSNSLKNQYSAAGVAVAEVNRLGALVVRHGVTTDVTSVNTREASVVRAKDALVTLVTNGFTESDIIGDPISTELLYAVKSVMQGYLETAVQDGMIVAYTGLSVRQRPDDPTVIEIKFGYKPSYPLNYIAIAFSIDMSNGETIETTSAAA